MKPKPSRAVAGRQAGWWWKWMLVAASLGLGTWAILAFVVAPPLPDGFPSVPDLRLQNPSLRSLLGDADEAARRRPGSAQDVGRLGMVYHANQFHDQAEKAYAVAARLEADDYRWPYLRALVREETGREAEVTGMLEAALVLRGDYVPVLQKLGDISYKRGDLEAAARFYERCAAAGTARLQGIFGLGRVAARRKEWSRVVELIAPLSREHPQIRPLHQLLLDAYVALGREDLAADERRALLEPTLIVVPLVPDPLGDELLGLSCSSTRLLKEAGLMSRFRRPDDAIRAARRAAEVEPGDADAHHFLARTLLEAHGDDPAAVNESLVHLEEGLRLRSEDLLPLWYFATAFFRQEKTAEAVEQIRNMVARHADKAESHYYMGLIADRQGRIEEAVAQYREALKGDPENAEAWHRLGLVHVRRVAIDDAIACFRKAVSLKPAFTMARSNLGVALDQQGRTAEAIAEFREGLRLKPNDAANHQYLAIALMRTGKIPEAVAHFREAVRFAPNDAEAHYGLGCALVLQRQTDEAAREFRRALTLRPGYPEARDQLLRLER